MSGFFDSIQATKYRNIEWDLWAKTHDTDYWPIPVGSMGALFGKAGSTAWGAMEAPIALVTGYGSDPAQVEKTVIEDSTSRGQTMAAEYRDALYKAADNDVAAMKKYVTLDWAEANRFSADANHQELLAKRVILPEGLEGTLPKNSSGIDAAVLAVGATLLASPVTPGMAGLPISLGA